MLWVDGTSLRYVKPARASFFPCIMILVRDSVLSPPLPRPEPARLRATCRLQTALQQRDAMQE